MSAIIGPRFEFTTAVDRIGRRWISKYADVTRYRNGDPIPQVTDNATWINLTTGAWCYYNNDSNNNNKYGKLYNGYAITDSRGIAPYGYRVPKLVDGQPPYYSDFLPGFSEYAWNFAQPENETPGPYLQTTFAGLRSGYDGSFFGIDQSSHFGLSDITEQNGQFYVYMADIGNADYETASDLRTSGYTIWFIQE
jgi:hypothetical protein